MGMKSNKNLKTFAVIYIVFWIGVFSVVISDRFSNEGSSVLSEIAALAGVRTEKAPEEPFFATPYVNSSTERKPIASISLKAKYADRRAEAVRIFLDLYNSPMEKCADTFVKESVKYEYEWKLSPAIAMIETAAGGAAPGHAYGNFTYNAFGFKTKEGYMWFDSWEDSIEYFSKRYGSRYSSEELDPEVMEEGYCPTCAAETPGKWASDVKHYMSQLQNIYDSLEP